jgi:uncharacterized protein YeaO (DUF488 family)
VSVPTAPRFVVHRVYDEHQARGYRVLVDRLWPRGVSKERAALEEWSKDAAPSDELRRWYGHEPEKFAEFTRRYRKELTASPAKEAVAQLRTVSKQRPVVLLTATRDLEHSGAVVLLAALAGRNAGARRGRSTKA